MFTVLAHLVTHWHVFVPFHFHQRIDLYPLPLPHLPR